MIYCGHHHPHEPNNDNIRHHTTYIAANKQQMVLIQQIEGIIETTYQVSPKKKNQDFVHMICV